MKFECDKASLAEAISGVSRAVTTRSSVPALEGILFRSEGNTLTLTGYDLEMGITTKIDARIKDEGSVVLSARLIGDMIRRLPSERVEIECSETLITTVKGGITEYNITGLSASDYPELPASAFQRGSEENKNGVLPAVEMDACTLKQMIETTIYAVSQDDKKPANNGEKFVLEEGKLTLVALDGFRLATATGKVVSSSSEHIEFVCPARTLNEIEKMLPAGEGKTELKLSRGVILVCVEDTILTSRLYNGDFIKKENIIPRSFHTQVKVERNLLKASIERAAILVRSDKNSLIILDITSDKIEISSNSEIGNVQEPVKASMEGTDLKIAMNSKFIIDAINTLDEDYMLLCFNNSVQPFICRNVDKNDGLYLILPVRTSNIA